jgi:bifunctional DNA-binding transcriptional regulator/antitoxin component of YhaV-PrlF toxin-antitoxin module
MSQPETWNLAFPAIIDERGRITIKKEILDAAKIKNGDTLFLILTGLTRKEA